MLTNLGLEFPEVPELLVSEKQKKKINIVYK
jgi:hypothetical protein